MSTNMNTAFLDKASFATVTRITPMLSINTGIKEI
jgi:hypothetical protein